MTTQIEEGLNRWQSIANTLNDIKQTQGEININNPVIWKGYLNRWENEDWELALTAVAFLLEQHPEIFKKYHVDAFKETARALVKYQTTTDRVLDKRLFKKSAWKMIMTMRELWNIANDDSISKEVKTRKLNEFSNLFER